MYRSGKQWDPQSDPSERDLLVSGVFLFSILHHIMLCCVVVCYGTVVMLCYATLFCIMSRYVTLCHVM